MKTQLLSLKSFTLLFLLGSLIFLSSCEEEPDLIGLEKLQNEKLGVEFSDTSSIIAYSVYDDSLRTDNYSACLLGTFNDPVFGTTSASIFTQLRLSNLSPSFGTSPLLDSLVLYLPYSGSYQAETMGDLQVKVYEVDQKMYIDSVYYSDRLLSYKPNLLADLTFTPKPKDSVTINGVKYPPMLQIKLSSTLGNALLASNSSNFTDNDKFTDYFRGLFIEAMPLGNQENKGSILYFNLLSSYANMSLYYKKNSSDTISNKFNFVINDKCAKYTNFNHYGYIGSGGTLAAKDTLKKQIGAFGYTKDTTLGQKKLYLQSMGGVKVNVKFPFLRDLIKNQKIVINEAVLVIKNDDVDDKNVPPSLLTILKKLASGKTEFLPDIYEGAAFFGGSYNSTTKEYRMRITRYFQQMLNKTDVEYSLENGLVMLIDSRRTTANRFVFKGTDKSLAGRMKLELKYTIIK
ncbi:MAG: DUF4270 domain-containing protein [Bacteroidales bacterium]